MDTLWESSVNLTQWLQLHYPELGGLMKFVSTLGIFEFYLAIIPLIYWTIHKQFGKHLAYLLSLGLLVNASFKGFLRGPRPYWLDASIGLASDVDYGVPSGHAQLSSLFYILAAGWARKGWAWGLAIFLALLMGFSRVFLGVHFWHDVLVGFLLSLALLLAYAFYLRYLRKRMRNRILGQRLLILTSVPVALGLLYALVRLILGEADTSVAWSAFVPAAELKSIEDVATALGLLLGLGIGFIFEASRTNFSEGGPIWQRLLRYLVGIALLVGLWYGSGLIFPDEPLLLAIPLRLIRYTFLGLFLAYWLPALFVKLRLATAGPGPEVRLSVSSDSLLKG